MLKTIALTMALGAGASYACTILMSNVRYDTVSPGVVVVTKAHYNPTLDDTVTTQRDTVKISRHQDMKAHFEGYFADSAMLFIARIDSGFYVADHADTSGIVPAIILSTPYDTVAAISRMYLKLSIDTVFRGTLPGKSFWVRAKTGYPLCGFPALQLKGQTFINASAGFAKLSDLKAPEDEGIGSLAYRPGFPAAEFFDGRYFVSPKFPGLRLDITELFPTYPATSVHRRNFPVIPQRLDGKAYRPDGRTVPEGAGADRKSPVPVLR